MRVFFTWLFLLLSVCCLSQNAVTVSGIAFDTTHGRNRVQITLNDTLNKFWLSKAPNWQEYPKLFKDSNYTVWAGKDGKFQIRGKKNDFLYFSSYGHIMKAYRIGDLLKMKVIAVNLEPEDCIPLCYDSLPAKLYVFVGEKIRLDPVTRKNYCNNILFDAEYAAEYRIVENLYGSFPGDTIKFTGFTHGRLSLGQFQHVLLFVGEYCGKLYHEKYQYFDVYKTTSGRWASPGDPYRYDRMVQTKTINAAPMTFNDTLWFDARTYGWGDIKQKFPEPYFRVEGDKATPLMGTYVEDLITVKKEGALKSKLH